MISCAADSRPVKGLFGPDRQHKAAGIVPGCRSGDFARLDSSKFALFDLADRRLAWVDRRQQILAQNVANADTPHFQARDVTPFAAQLASAGIVPAQTNPMHLAGTLPAGAKAAPTPGERAPDGNAVSLDVELSKIADTDATHELVGDLYRKYLGFFRTAIGR